MPVEAALSFTRFCGVQGSGLGVRGLPKIHGWCRYPETAQPGFHEAYEPLAMSRRQDHSICCFCQDYSAVEEGDAPGSGVGLELGLDFLASTRGCHSARLRCVRR